MRYRPDIDGLRALAVLPVVAFHIQLPLFTGGYVGVDIFFLISGYLIGMQIMNDLDASKFSIVSFYQRRIARILPAFLAMIAVTLALGWRFAMPTEFNALARSAIAAIFSVSNILFWSEASYFDTAADSKPLLHTWSLGVEEQFYIILPLLLIALSRFGRAHRFLVLAIACFASLLACVAMTAVDATTAFYWIPFRFWELGLGTLIAMPQIASPRSVLLRNAIATAGILAILWCIFRFDSTTPFPGIAAALPCLGAAAILISGKAETAFVNRALAVWPLRFVGLISYSLYLWHWPLMVYGRSNAIFFGYDGRLTSKLMLVVIIFVVAVLSWMFVEKPIRRLAMRSTPRRVIAGAVTAMLIIFAAGGATVATGGFSGRFPEEAVKIASYLAYDTRRMDDRHCFVESSAVSADFDFSRCMAVSADKPNVLLIGDSHAAHLWPGLSSVYPEINLLQATAVGCKPTIAAVGLAMQVNAACRKLFDDIYQSFLPQHPGVTVLMAARWWQSDLAGLDATLAELQRRGVNTIVVGPIVQYEYALPRLLADEIRFSEQDRASRYRVTQISAIDDSLRQLVKHRGGSYVSLLKTLCSESSCLTRTEAGVPLQFDAAHLTAEGSVATARRLRSRSELPLADLVGPSQNSQVWRGSLKARPAE